MPAMEYMHRQGGTHKQNLSLACISMRPAIGDIPAAKNASQRLGYRGAHCISEFASRPAMDCHRRHPNSVGTPCADPNNSKSMSFTARASVSSSILRQHDTLGAAAISAYCIINFHVHIVAQTDTLFDITCIIAIIKNDEK